MSSQAVVPPTPSATIAAGVALPLVGGILVGMRFFAKHTQRAGLHIEDWLTIPALLLVLALGICLIYGVIKHALAYPTPQPANLKDLPTFRAPELTINRQLEYAVLMIQIPAITCIKLSFLFFYKRIFCTQTTRSRVKVTLWILIVICVLWCLGFLFTFIFICGTHISALWGTLLEFKQHCSRILDWNLWLSTTDFVLDIIIFLFPMPLLWRLQMSTTRKFAVIGVFMIGGLTLAASITRMVIFVRAVQALKMAYKAKGADNSVVTAGLYWTTFEVGMGLISVCLPSSYGLFKQLLSKHFGFRTTNGSKPSKHMSSKFTGSGFHRDGHYKLEESLSDDIPLNAPGVSVTTDIQVDYGARDSSVGPNTQRVGLHGV